MKAPVAILVSANFADLPVDLYLFVKRFISLSFRICGWFQDSVKLFISIVAACAVFKTLFLLLSLTRTATPLASIRVLHSKLA